jgi:hypothetical protein
LQRRSAELTSSLWVFSLIASISPSPCCSTA